MARNSLGHYCIMDLVPRGGGGLVVNQKLMYSQEAYFGYIIAV